MSRRLSQRTITHSLAGVGVALGLLALSGAAHADTDEGTWVANCPKGKHRFHCKSYTRVDSQKRPMVIRPGANPQATTSLTAANIQTLYSLDVTRTPNATIAIVDAFGYTNAESDLKQYRSANNLPACTSANGCFTVVNQTGQTSPLPPQGTGGQTGDEGWTVETALDLDMASATCPNCKILLVQADNADGDGLMIAQQTAASLGASVISNSWGGPDPDGSGSTMGEMYFQVNPAINIFVATGDDAVNNIGMEDDSANPPVPPGPDYPSTSAFAIGVGATNVTLGTNGARKSETAWASGGSSCSVTIAKPSYQSSVVPAAACGFRAASDVSAIGGSPGVNVYNSPIAGGMTTGVKGTSVASPVVAGIFALYGFSKSDPAFPYNHASAFYDIGTGGSNAATVTDSKYSAFSCSSSSANQLLCNTATGWDGPTGIGTPNGAALAMIPPEPAAPAAPPADMTPPVDMAQAPVDMAMKAPQDMAVGGTGSNGGGSSSGGGSAGGNSGGGSSSDGGCGCSLGGAQSGNGLVALPLLAFLGFVIVRRRRRA